MAETISPSPVPPDVLAAVHDAAVRLARYGYPATPSAIRTVLGPDLPLRSANDSRIAVIRDAIADLVSRGKGPWQPGDADAPDDEQNYEGRSGYTPSEREIWLSAARLRCGKRLAGRTVYPGEDLDREPRVYRLARHGGGDDPDD